MAGHFLGHEEKEPPVSFIHLAQLLAKLHQVTSILAGATPGKVGSSPSIGKERKRRRLLAVIEQLIERNFERPSHLFQGLNGRNGMPILNAGNVASKQTSALFDVPLG